jgi:uncharacterized protein YbaR (Trm112 family)
MRKFMDKKDDIVISVGTWGCPKCLTELNNKHKQGDYYNCQKCNKCFRFSEAIPIWVQRKIKRIA